VNALGMMAPLIEVFGPRIICMDLEFLHMQIMILMRGTFFRMYAKGLVFSRNK
jgi:hypothetical protein